MSKQLIKFTNMKHVIISLICILAVTGTPTAQTTETLSVPADTHTAKVSSDQNTLGMVDSLRIVSEKVADTDSVIVDETGTIYLASDDCDFHSDDNVIPDNLIRLIGVILTFGSPIGIIWIILGYRNLRYREKLRIVEKSLDQHTPLPPEFFTGSIKPSWYNLYSGIIWVGIGLAIIIFFLVLDEPVWTIGLIPTFIGISKIIVYTVVNRQKNTIVPPIPDMSEKDAE